MGRQTINVEPSSTFAGFDGDQFIITAVDLQTMMLIGQSAQSEIKNAKQPDADNP